MAWWDCWALPPRAVRFLGRLLQVREAALPIGQPEGSIEAGLSLTAYVEYWGYTPRQDKLKRIPKESPET